MFKLGTFKMISGHSPPTLAGKKKILNSLLELEPHRMLRFCHWVQNSSLYLSLPCRCLLSLNFSTCAVCKFSFYWEKAWFSGTDLVCVWRLGEGGY